MRGHSGGCGSAVIATHFPVCARIARTAQHSHAGPSADQQHCRVAPMPKYWLWREVRLRNRNRDMDLDGHKHQLARCDAMRTSILLLTQMILHCLKTPAFTIIPRPLEGPQHLTSTFRVRLGHRHLNVRREKGANRRGKFSLRKD
jgi:hypothetical protein